MITKYKNGRTTLTLPLDLLERSKHFIDRGLLSGRNALIIAALEQFLRDLEQQEIDQQLETMAED